MKQTISMLFGRSKIAFAVVILFAFGLLAGVLFSFPEMKLKQKIISSLETQSHVVIEQGDINIGFLNIEGSDLLIRSDNPLWPAILINSIHIAPKWLTLFSKNPGVHLDMQLSGGTLAADMFRDGTLNAVASQLSLEPLLPKDQLIKVSGLLAETELATTVPLKKTTESLLQLTLKGVNIVGSRGMKLSLNLGDINLNGTGHGRSFKITALTADNGDLAINGQGNILLGRNLAATQVKMKISVRPQKNVDPMLVELLTLGSRQTASGSYELNLTGTLSELLYHNL